MDTLIATFESWLRAGAGWAPVAVFVITFLESLPGISLLVRPRLFWSPSGRFSAPARWGRGPS